MIRETATIAAITARHCGRTKVHEDGSGISAAAFMLRRDGQGVAKEDSLSGGWLEKYSPNGLDAQVANLRVVWAKNLTYKPRDRFAFVNVGHVVHVVKTHTAEQEIRFLHDPDDDDDAHAGIYDTAENEQRIAELIAMSVSSTPLAIP